MALAPRPKYQTVADDIETELRRGRWDGDANRMPSVRGIADRFKVSIVTASRALQVLRDKGLVDSRERSGTFRLPPPSAERWAVVLRTTPGTHQASVTAVPRGGFEAVARRQPMHLHFDAFALPDTLTPNQAETAARAAKGEGIGGVFLLPSRASDAAAAVDAAFLAGLSAAGLPAVLLERDLRNQTGPPAVDLVALDDVAGAADSTRHLMDLGRKRVALAVASPTSSHHDRAAGYLFALHAGRRRAADYPDLLVRLPDELPTAAAAGFLADRVLKDRIDGIVCYHDYIALGLIVELLTRGVRVPDDVAVSGFDDIDLGGLFPPGLTTYAYPAEGMAEQAVRLMRARVQEPGRPPVKVVVPGRLVVRGSTVRSEE